MRKSITLEDSRYTVLLDKRPNFKEAFETLQAQGGYQILYSGQITSKKGSITYKESQEIFKCLGAFLSFINGSKISAIFRQGISSGVAHWGDFGPYPVTEYRYAFCWSYYDQTSKFSNLWASFRSYFKDKEGRKCLESILDWYCEANSSKIFIETKIIVVQATLEFLYNWIIVERKQLLKGDDASKINASNKIRLLLAEVNVPDKIPATQVALKILTGKNLDAADVLISIRNAIVHSNLDKRRKLEVYSPESLNEALQIGLWYVELLLLLVLDY